MSKKPGGTVWAVVLVWLLGAAVNAAEPVSEPVPEPVSESVTESVPESEAGPTVGVTTAPDNTAAGDASAAASAEALRDALTQSVASAAGVSFHKNMYIAPLSYSEDYHDWQTEVVFQLSFKARLFGGPLYFGYTQRSYWQAYDKDNSSPFRETNYNPELFARFQPGEWWSDKWGIDLGIEHESNGRTVPDSRSWNRLYAMAFHEGQDDLLSIKAWYRLKEDPKPDTRSAEGDDNPDILDYYGIGELRYRRCLDGALCHQLFESMLRGNLDTGKGAIELMWSFPAESEQMSWFVSLFSGYGESLIDYNQQQNRIAVGVTLRPH